MKFFLLTIHDRYYPSGGSSDWIETFKTREEAEAEGERIIKERNDNDVYYRVVNLESWVDSGEDE